MSLLTPIALKTVLMVAGVLAGLTVIAYILKMRRRRFEVPFSSLWQRVLKEKENTILWKHLRRLLSLLLQLSILALLLAAVLDPRLGEGDEDARSVVIIVDASASMKAVDEGDDGSLTRMEMAKRRARDLLRAMGGGDAAMIMRMDGQTTPLSRMSSDMPMLHRVLGRLEASDTPADLGRALSAAADALRERKNPMIVLIGDGVYPQDVLDNVVWTPLVPPTGSVAPARPAGQAGAGQADKAGEPKRLGIVNLSGIDVHFIPVGQRGDNVGIVAFNARRYLTDKTSYSVFVEVQNFSQKKTARKLVVYSGDTPVDVKSIALGPGERVREIYPNLGGGQENNLRAELQPSSNDDGAGDSAADIFPVDDQAVALLPARRKQKVLLVTLDNLYLEGAMLVYDNIRIDKLTPEEYEQASGKGELPVYDAVVFDDVAPESLPPASAHLIYFHPTGANSPFPIRRTISAPYIDEVNESHPVMRWVVLSDVNFDQSAVFALDAARGDVWLARSARDPIIAARRDGGQKIVAFGFSLGGTDLTLRVAFPLLLVNTLDWFAGDDSDLITTYQTGHRFRVPMDGLYGVKEVEVRTPSGRLTRAPVVDGHATFYGNFIGVHRLVARDGGVPIAEVELAANLSNPAESSVLPQREVVLGGVTLTAPVGFTISARRSLWVYLALLVALLLCVEWITYNRRITV